MLAHPQPCLQTDNAGNPVFFSAVPYAAYAEQGRQYFQTANELVDHFYAIRTYRRQFQVMQDALYRVLRKQIRRLEKNVCIHQETMLGKEKADKFLLYGELTSANLYQLKRGASVAEVLNYYTGEMVKIPLDPAISPAQNATKFFKKASKMKHGAALAQEHYEKDFAELTYLRSLEFDAASAADLDDLRRSAQRAHPFWIYEPGPAGKAAPQRPARAPTQIPDHARLYSARRAQQPPK